MKKIGILGGMGPQATILLFQMIVDFTNANTDQDHIQVFVDSNPKIPSRQNAILNGGPSPVPAMKNSLRNLESVGADLVIIPCNTAHYYLCELRENAKTEILDIIQICIEHIQKQFPNAQNIGILATQAMIHTKIWQQKLSGYGLNVILPDPLIQHECFEKSVFGPQGIKAGFCDHKNKVLMIRSALNLVFRGADIIIAACTEVPIVLKKNDIPVPLVDPLEEGAKYAVQRATKEEIAR